MTTFKAGDKVYAPHLSTHVFTLETFDDKTYCVKVNSTPLETTNGYSGIRPVTSLLIFTKHGQLNEGGMHCLYPATEENQKMLGEFHYITFEKAPPSTKMVEITIDGSTYIVPETMTIKEVLNQ